MISNYVFAALAADSVNSTAAAELAAVNRRMGTSMVAGDLPDFIYTSLKTLLGETSIKNNDEGIPVWAVNRIKSGTDIQKFSYINKPDDLPLIFIKCGNIVSHPVRNGFGIEAARVEISVFVNPQSAPSSKASSIMRRINNLFCTYGDVTGRPQPKELAPITGIKGLLNLKLELKAYPEANWDTQRCIFAAEAKVIQ